MHTYMHTRTQSHTRTQYEQEHRSHIRVHVVYNFYFFLSFSFSSSLLIYIYISTYISVDSRREERSLFPIKLETLRLLYARSLSCAFLVSRVARYPHCGDRCLDSLRVFKRGKAARLKPFKRVSLFVKYPPHPCCFHSLSAKASLRSKGKG